MPIDCHVITLAFVTYDFQVLVLPWLVSHLKLSSTMSLQKIYHLLSKSSRKVSLVNRWDNPVGKLTFSQGYPPDEAATEASFRYESFSVRCSEQV